MQVKKFEAKSMQEALRLVKTHLGPDAIILSAKDNGKGFGLVGSRSIEVTAAVSEETLRKKQMAEKKMNERLRERFLDSPARLQKQFIEKANRPVAAEEQEPKRPRTSVPYIDIDNDQEAEASASPRPDAARERIRAAARRAWEAGKEVAPTDRPKSPLAANRPVTASNPGEIRVLQEEIARLRQLIEGFNKVPQSFVHLHPGAEEGLSYAVSASFQKLTRAGVSREVATEILKKAEVTLGSDQLKKGALIDAWVARHILDHVPIASQRTLARYHVFVGGPGQGKTSSLVKLASHLVVCEKKKVAIVTTDATRVGAAEQLRIYAQILNVPFAVMRRPEDWQAIEQKLAGFDHILVDSAGQTLKSIAELDQFREMLPPSNLNRAVHLVVSAMAKDAEAFDIADRFKALGFDDLIFTHIDASNTHGIILNFIKRYQTALHSFSIGANVPEDFEPATKERVIDLIYKLSRIKKKEDAHD